MPGLLSNCSIASSQDGGTTQEQSSDSYSTTSQQVRVDFSRDRFSIRPLQPPGRSPCAKASVNQMRPCRPAPAASTGIKSGSHFRPLLSRLNPGIVPRNRCVREGRRLNPRGVEKARGFSSLMQGDMAYVLHRFLPFYFIFCWFEGASQNNCLEQVLTGACLSSSGGSPPDNRK